MTTVFLEAVFKPFFNIVHDTGQQLTIDGTNFLTDSFLQLIQRTGFVSVNIRFQIPPKEKSHVERSGERGDQGTSPKREMKCRETCFEQWSLTKSPLLLKWSIQRKSMPTTSSPPSGHLLSTTQSKYVTFPWVTLYNLRAFLHYWLSTFGKRLILSSYSSLTRGEFRPRQTRQLPRAVDLKGRLPSCQSY